MTRGNPTRRRRESHRSKERHNEGALPPFPSKKHPKRGPRREGEATQRRAREFSGVLFPQTRLFAPTTRGESRLFSCQETARDGGSRQRPSPRSAPRRFPPPKGGLFPSPLPLSPAGFSPRGRGGPPEERNRGRGGPRERSGLRQGGAVPPRGRGGSLWARTNTGAVAVLPRGGVVLQRCRRRTPLPPFSPRGGPLPVL